MPETTVGMRQQDRAERERFENEVRRIVGAGEAAGVTLRLLGSLAFQVHCPKFGFLQEKMGRAYTDLERSYVQSNFPEIRISGGIARRSAARSTPPTYAPPTKTLSTYGEVKSASAAA